MVATAGSSPGELPTPSGGRLIAGTRAARPAADRTAGIPVQTIAGVGILYAGVGILCHSAGRSRGSRL
jgi:hypothetical protein